MSKGHLTDITGSLAVVDKLLFIGAETAAMGMASAVARRQPELFEQQFVVHDEIDDIPRYIGIIQGNRDHQRVPCRLIVPELSHGGRAVPDQVGSGHPAAEI